MAESDMSCCDELRDRLDRIESLLRTRTAPLTYEDLRERGYSQKEAYGLLHRHGVQLPGAKRLRISLDVLEKVERGEL